MEEIQIGEYVRTDKGKITKVINVEIENYKDGTTEVFIETELNPGYLDYTNKDILKHSKNIIDLIEVGDYVNGSEVLDKHIPRDTWEPIELRIDSKYVNFIIADDIKTILTKEVYERNCYKVEG